MLDPIRNSGQRGGSDADKDDNPKEDRGGLDGAGIQAPRVPIR
ncbi:MAG: hypothetical protein SX243_15595 [Acidobacteriota bacterium]|nr:hypothetical protein [Acidobacteriota bacterium]